MRKLIRIVSVILLAAGVIALSFPIILAAVLPLLPESTSFSAGVIGGADGPTAILVTVSSPGFWDFTLPLILIALSMAGIALSRKKPE